MDWCLPLRLCGCEGYAQVLLRVVDHIRPGLVQWKKVEMRPNNKFKCGSNCNYLLELCRKLDMRMIGVGGNDISDGHKKLTLAVGQSVPII